MKKIDRTGHRYNFLTVIREAPKQGKATMWECRCDCGATLIVQSGGLHSGKSKSCVDCGRKRQAQKIRKHNEYIEKDDFLVVDISTPLSPKHYMLIDKCDRNILDAPYRIIARRSRGLVYAFFSGKMGAVHRLICGAQSGENVDHINGNTLDNRRVNLRIADQSENCKNIAIRKSNKTGHSGVKFNKKTGKYQSFIGANSKVYLGAFENLDDAIMARKKAELDHGYHENHGRQKVDSTNRCYAEPVFDDFE